MKGKILCISGPTASGKTAYAIRMAKEKDGEVVSCDSMQIYRYMDIGTAKPSKEEMEGIPHHMLDFVDPWVNYSVAEFVRDARRCIDDILSRGKLPVLCGGTGLYIDSILNQIDFPETKEDPALRRELAAYAGQYGAEALHERLRAADPISADRIHPNNIKRVIRAIEVFETTGKPKSELDLLARKTPVYEGTLICLSPDRKALYDRINRRVDLMMERGLTEEVKNLLSMGVTRKMTAMQAIGYKEIADHLAGECSLAEAVDKIKQESRRYAKRQLTWFRRNPDVVWLDPYKVQG